MGGVCLSTTPVLLIVAQQHSFILYSHLSFVRVSIAMKLVPAVNGLMLTSELTQNSLLKQSVLNILKQPAIVLCT